MDQSALNIKLERNRSITDIAIDYGYSSSNYSWAFKKHHTVSPVEFRKSINTKHMKHPFYINKIATFDSYERYDEKITIKQFDDFIVLYERYIGNYTDLGDNWSKFIKKYGKYFTEDTLLIERFYDDPSITDIDNCLYDICMTVDNKSGLENMNTIEGGKYAVYAFDGNIDDVFTDFQGVFNVWLPNSDYIMDERYGIGIYRDMDIENNYVSVDLCIPLK